MTLHRDNSRRSERGFALLLVFLMAAAVAIMLYMEMPRVAFETQRSRELLLIERGEEYKRAISLYVRKFQRYPQSLDDLEKSNNIRFLRKRFKDPLTGKDEWRLIHTNGSFLTDSLVEKPPDINANSKQGNFSSETNAAPPDQQAPPQMAAAAQMRPSDRGVMPPPGFNANPQQEPDPNNPMAVNPGGPLPPGQMEPGDQPNPVAPPDQEQPGQPQMTPSGVPYPGQQQTMPSGVPYPGQQTMPSGVPYPGQPQTMPSGVPYPGQVQPQPYPVQGQPFPQGGQVQTMPSGVPYPGQTQTMPSGVPYPGQLPPGQPQRFPQPVAGQPYPGQQQYPGQQPYLGQQPYPGQQANQNRQLAVYPVPIPGVPGMPAGANRPNPQQIPYPPSVVNTTPGRGGMNPYPQPVQNPQVPQMPPNRPTTGQNQAIGLIKQILTTPRPGGLQGLQQQQQAQTSFGSGIAGVASTADAEGIRVYNERTNYKEWEFVYDPNKEAQKAAGMMVPGNAQQQTQGQGSTFGGQRSTFGNQGSSFGGQGSTFGGQGSTFGGQGSTFGGQSGGATAPGRQR